MTLASPLVSIGMPIYNAEKYLSRALESLLAQDYSNFELVISDNASTDGTAEICQGYAAHDARIQYSRNDVNMGSLYNFKRVLELATGEYFIWAAHDDKWSASFIARCVQTLNKNPGAVLAFPDAVLIDEGEKELEIFNENVDTRDLNKLERIHKLLKNLSRNTAYYGLYRRSIVKQLSFISHYGGDHIFMAQLSLYGNFIHIPEPLFYSRIGGIGSSPGASLESLKDRSLIQHWLPNISLFLRFLWESTRWPKLTFREHIKIAGFITERFTSPPYPDRIRNDFKVLLEKPIYTIRQRSRMIPGMHYLKALRDFLKKI